MIRQMFAGACAAGLGLVLLAGPAEAQSSRVEAKGSCSASSDWRLRLTPIVKKDLLKVQGKIDEGVAGSTWHIVASDNGVIVFEGDLVTRLDGELQKTVKVAGVTGHAFQIDATNAATGETCSASASI